MDGYEQDERDLISSKELHTTESLSVDEIYSILGCDVLDEE